jgi:acetyl esterase/lipase
MGLGVLSLESRVCRGDRGTFGYYEGDDVHAAYQYLRSRDDVDPARISVHGFSAAGAASIFGAARTPESRAVSAMGNYHDFGAVIGIGNRDVSPIERLYRIGVVWGFESTGGVSLDKLRPIDAIPTMAPRPVRLVYGSQEVSLSGGEAMDAAGDNARLWEVPGAIHGNYLEVAPDGVRDYIGGFHRDVLLHDADHLLTDLPNETGP